MSATVAEHAASTLPAGTGRGTRVAWIIAGSILAVGMLWWGAFNVVALLAHEERTVVETVDASGLHAIEIRNDDGGIRVEGADTDVITVTARLSEGLQDPETRQMLWRSDWIVPRASADPVSVPVLVPAKLLRPGHHSLELTGRDTRGTAEVIGIYTVRIVRP